LSRKIDTATLRTLANEGRIRNAQHALEYKFVDGLKYDDQIKLELKGRLKLKKDQKLDLVSMSRYLTASGFDKQKGGRIALVYAEGNIIDGRGTDGRIGGDDYRDLIYKLRMDKNVKAIVFRVNSGGGSALASENIWRELSEARKVKPVVVSFGDVAASGGYYIGCAGDSIFADPSTITGSIGVFGIIPNMEAFFKNKIGVTFDGVKTGPYADLGSVARPMNEEEKIIVQEEIDRIYTLFKKRVADGRKLDAVKVDSIAQGRVWTGMRAKEIGLIDHFGGTEDAINCAARMAKLDQYRIRTYPEPVNVLDKLFKKTTPFGFESQLRQELGELNYNLYKQMQEVKEMTNSVQARLPFQFIIQ
jgi:protease-4